MSVTRIVGNQGEVITHGRGHNPRSLGRGATRGGCPYPHLSIAMGENRVGIHCRFELLGLDEAPITDRRYCKSSVCYYTERNDLCNRQGRGGVELDTSSGNV